VASQVIALGQEGYPESLMRLPNPPEGLHIAGNIVPQDRLAVAIVGTRNPTQVGKWVAREFAEDMAGAGVTVVSGLARGIDGIAHRAAIRAGGRTIACLGCGVDVVYPPENEDLYREIPHHGALLSEFGDGVRPLKYHFPRRNRLIAGLSLGVVVIEAGARSGALNTASWALHYGIPVMAVPGSVKSPKSAGANKLIQEGAYLVTSAQDVLSFLGRETECVPVPLESPKRLAATENTLEESLVLHELRGHPLSADALCERLSNMPAGRVAAVLACLEMKGAVQRTAAGKFLALVGQARNGKERS
jgi:DNA processing protein